MALRDQRVAPLAVEVDVEKHDVDVLVLHHRACRRKGVRLEDLVTLELEIHATEQANGRFVVNDEDPRRRRMPLGIGH